MRIVEKYNMKQIDSLSSTVALFFRHGGHGIKGAPILIFFCEFCRGDGGECVYGVTFSKGGLWWSRSSDKSCNNVSKIL
jgi:hypothetical protein